METLNEIRNDIINQFKKPIKNKTVISLLEKAKTIDELKEIVFDCICILNKNNININNLLLCVKYKNENKEFTLINGKLDGEVNHLLPDGTIYIRDIYDDGERIESKTYREGELHTHKKYKNGELHKCTIYENGVIKTLDF